MSTINRSTVEQNRNLISDSLVNGSALVGIIGPCSLDGSPEQMSDSLRIVEQIETMRENGVVLANRIPPWKPRTNPTDWHGREDDGIGLAQSDVMLRVGLGLPVAMELGKPEHIERYGSLASFCWTGSRSLKDEALYNELLDSNNIAKMIRMPLGVKNALDGEVGHALERIDRLTRVRQIIGVANGIVPAPVMLIYRGGSNATNPEDWVQGYYRAYKKSHGRIIVDTAHGGEQAHDRSGIMTKTMEGQIRCIGSVIKLKEILPPRGVMIEAASGNSKTDPNIKLSAALGGLLVIAGIKNFGLNAENGRYLKSKGWLDATDRTQAEAGNYVRRQLTDTVPLQS